MAAQIPLRGASSFRATAPLAMDHRALHRSISGPVGDAFRRAMCRRWGAALSRQRFPAHAFASLVAIAWTTIVAARGQRGVAAQREQGK